MKRIIKWFKGLIRSIRRRRLKQSPLPSPRKTTGIKTKDLIANIFLDIETSPCEEPRLDSFAPKANLVDPVKIARDLEEKKDKAWRASMLDAFSGEIFCIGLALNEDEAFAITGTDERELMQSFNEWLKDFSFPKIYAHFGSTFDFQWLWYKGLKHKCPTVVNMFSKGSGLSKLIDTAKIMDNLGYKEYVSLDKMHKLLFGVPAKNMGVDGSKVFDLIMQKKGDEVIKYCVEEDVPALRRCCKELDQYGLLR